MSLYDKEASCLLFCDRGRRRCNCRSKKVSIKAKEIASMLTFSFEFGASFQLLYVLIGHL
jgi:hypothetical protein